MIAEDENEKEHLSKDVEKDDIQLNRNQRSKSLDTTDKPDGFDPVSRRISSIMSLGHMGGIEILKETPEDLKHGKWYLSTIYAFSSNKQ